jgi:hypothetical protein
MVEHSLEYRLYPLEYRLQPATIEAPQAKACTPTN